MEGMSGDAMVFYLIGALFIGAIIIGIARENSSGRYSKPLPNRPEMQTGHMQGMQTMPDIQGNFDANALNTAKMMAMEMERYPDPTSRTLALAEMIHRQKAYEQRQADRVWQEQKRESDLAERLISAVAGRMSGRQMMMQNPPVPPAQQNPYMPYPDMRDMQDRRINDYHHYRETPDDMNARRGGFWR